MVSNLIPAALWTARALAAPGCRFRRLSA